VYLLVAVAGLTTILWQYRRRGIIAGRCFAGATVILLIAGFPWISWHTAMNIQSSLAKTPVDLSSAHLISDLGMEKPAVAFRQAGGYVGVRVPLQLAGLPSGASAMVEHLSISFQVPDGTAWKSEEFAWENPKGPDQQFFIQSGFYGAAYLTRNDVPVKVHGTLYFTVFGNPQTTQVPFGDHFVLVAQVGLCSATESHIEGYIRRNYLLLCNSAFRSPAALVSYRFAGSDQDSTDHFRPLSQQRQPSFSPFPAELRISPVSHEYTTFNDLETWDRAVIQTLEPLGHIRLDFDVDAGRMITPRNKNEKIQPKD
jgi:hypothetical protein